MSQENKKILIKWIIPWTHLLKCSVYITDMLVNLLFIKMYFKKLLCSVTMLLKVIMFAT